MNRVMPKTYVFIAFRHKYAQPGKQKGHLVLICQEKTLDKLRRFVYDSKVRQKIDWFPAHGVRIMDEIFKQTLLYDFYGELLTEHQKSVYEDFIFQDLSLSEIAAMRGISRQGVFDLLHRINKILENYEAKLHLVERFLSLKKDVAAIEETVGKLKEKDPDADVSEMEAILAHMREMI